MADDTKITSLEDHRAKLQQREQTDNKECDAVAVNPQADPEIIKDLDACVTPADIEAALRVLSTLRLMGDKVTIDLDESSIFITTYHDPYGDIDAGVDFPEQVIKKASTQQSSTINFEYNPDDWDTIDDFLHNVAFSFRRCLESLTYWGIGSGEEDKGEQE